MHEYIIQEKEKLRNERSSNRVIQEEAYWEIKKQEKELEDLKRDEIFLNSKIENLNKLMHNYAEKNKVIDNELKELDVLIYLKQEEEKSQ